MANGLARQTKLWRIAIKPETTLGTFTESSSLNVPMVSGWTLTPDRGTGIIQRADVTDGRAGSVLGSPGSYGWSLSGDQEVQIEEDTIWLPWVWTLIACGHKADVTTGSGIVTLTPTFQTQSGYTGGTDDQSPGSLSAIAIYDTNGTADAAQRVRGLTGSAQIKWTAGSRMMIGAALKGLVYETGGASQMIDYADTSLTDIGTWETQNLPRVALSAVTTFTDLSDSSTLALEDFQEFTLDSAATVPDIASPATLNGLGVSPVFWNDAPTLTMSIAASQAADLDFFAGWRDGRLFSMSTVYGVAGSNQITLAVAALQLAGPPTRQDAEGKDRLALTFRCVRAELGSTADLYSLVYKYNAA